MKKKMPKPKTEINWWDGVLTVDPGLGGTGIVYWLNFDLPHPQWGKVLHSKHTRNHWIYRANSIVDQFKREIEPITGLVVIENQSMWDSSEAAFASARKGDIVKLAQLTGMMMKVALDAEMEVHLISPMNWKGQLPKRTVHSRIRKILGKKYREHEADAIGIGLHLQGLL